MDFCGEELVHDGTAGLFSGFLCSGLLVPKISCQLFTIVIIIIFLPKLLLIEEVNLLSVDTSSAFGPSCLEELLSLLMFIRGHTS